MKQATVILAVLTVLLLAASGFVAAGSLRQSEVLLTRSRQLNEANDRLASLKSERLSLWERLEKREEELSALQAQRDELSVQLSDALLSIEEANGVIAQKELEWEAAQAAFSGERGDMALQLERLEKQSEEWISQINQLTAQRDQLLEELEALSTPEPTPEPTPKPTPAAGAR